jgi:hypothetical protein
VLDHFALLAVQAYQTDGPGYSAAWWNGEIAYPMKYFMPERSDMRRWPPPFRTAVAAYAASRERRVVVVDDAIKKVGMWRLPLEEPPQRTGRHEDARVPDRNGDLTASRLGGAG